MKTNELNRRAVGSEYEKLAASFLSRRGYRIIKRNFRTRAGEIDVICVSPEGILVFCEVKYRSSMLFGDPAEAVGYAKQKKICRVSAVYLSGISPGSYEGIRYDVIGVYPDGSIRHIENAFDYIG